MKLILSAAIYLSFTFGFSQSTFYKHYHGGEDHARKFEITADSGFVLCGYVDVGTGYPNDGYIVRLNSDGDTLWSKRYSFGADLTIIEDIACTLDGGYYVSGQTRANDTLSTLQSDIYIAKLDSIGNIEWQNTIGEQNKADGSWTVCESFNGGCIVAGYSTSYPGNFVNSAYISKLDSGGSLLWTRTVEPNVYTDNYYEIQQTNDSNYILTGGLQTSSICGSTRMGIPVTKIDDNGNIIWSYVYGVRCNHNKGNWIDQTSDNGYIVGGSTANMGLPDDGYLLKLDSMGVVQWSKSYVFDTNQRITGVQEVSNGDYIVCGYQWVTSSNFNTFLMRVSSVGDPIWARLYGGPASELNQNVREYYDGGFIMFYDSKSYVSSTGEDFVLVKTDSVGNSGCHSTIQTVSSSNLTTLSFPLTNFGTGGVLYPVSITAYSVETEIYVECEDLCSGVVNTSISLVNDTIIQSVASGAQYQWLNCDNNYAVINGEINQSYVATTNGNFAVQVTENGCVDTSACISIVTIGIIETEIAELGVSPNPTDGQIEIDLGNHYDKVILNVYDAAGRIVQNESRGNISKTDLLIDQPPGTYTLEIVADTKRAVVRIVKQ